MKRLGLIVRSDFGGGLANQSLETSTESGTIPSDGLRDRGMQEDGPTEARVLPNALHPANEARRSSHHRTIRQEGSASDREVLAQCHETPRWMLAMVNAQGQVRALRRRRSEARHRASVGLRAVHRSDTRRPLSRPPVSQPRVRESGALGARDTWRERTSRRGHHGAASAAHPLRERSSIQRREPVHRKDGSASLSHVYARIVPPLVLAEAGSQ